MALPRKEQTIIHTKDTTSLINLVINESRNSITKYITNNKGYICKKNTFQNTKPKDLEHIPLSWVNLHDPYLIEYKYM